MPYLKQVVRVIVSKKLIVGYVRPRVLEKNTEFFRIRNRENAGELVGLSEQVRETFNYIELKFVAENALDIRGIIKRLDFLLKVGGDFVLTILEVHKHGEGLRSPTQIKNEFSLSTNGRYKMEQEDGQGIIRLKYKKVGPTFVPGDEISKWSFGILSNGEKAAEVNSLVNSIQRQGIPEVQITICGPHPARKDIEIIDVDNDGGDVRAPISKKKNKLVDNARFENIVLLHDRYILPDDWYLNFKKYGNAFEMLAVRNEGPRGGRVADWMIYDGLPSQPNAFSHLAPYNKRTGDFYMAGGIMIIKKAVYQAIRLDERLYWGELEDVQFSKIAQLKGFQLTLDSRNKVLTNSKRLGEKRDRTVMIFFIRHTYELIRHFIKSQRNRFLHLIVSRSGKY